MRQSSGGKKTSCSHSSQEPVFFSDFPTLWKRISSPFLVVAVFASLTLVVTYPIVFKLDSGLAQNPEWTHDAFHHTYVLWWFKKALLEFHVSPADLRLIHFPFGGHYPLLLTFSTVYVVGLPLLLFLSPTVTYNILFLLTFFLSGLSGYVLCAYLTRNRYAGILGGIVYAFYPNRMAHALSGHLELISTYLFPLYILLLIKTIRRPRTVTALFCGLTLAGSLLVQPLFIPLLLVPVTLVWLLWELLALRQPIERRAMFALVCAFGLAVSLAAPFFWPVLREQAQGQNRYLEDEGTVRFSADLLGIVAPSPLNPFLRALKIVPPYAYRVVPTNWRIGELLTYAGVVPLVLSGLAIYGHRRKVGVWVVLVSAAALFSLGPLLKVNGQLVTFTTDGIESAITLPYAILASLPLISYNRAPARINTTLMLTMAVLASYGLAWVLTNVRRTWKGIVAGVMCVFALGELLVVWPCPIVPLKPLASLSEIFEDTESRAVLNLPLTSWDARELGLFYQIYHEHPIFDGWVQRSISASADASGFLDRLFHPPSGADIIPDPSEDNRAAIARAEGIGHIFLFTHYSDDVEAQTQLLSASLGSPKSVNGDVAIYRVPEGPTTVDELVYVLSVKGWWPAETWEGKPARWMSRSTELDIYSPDERAGVLRFKALPASAPQRLQIEVNGDILPPLVIGDWMTYTTPLFTLRPGLNRVTFRALGGCTTSVIDPRCAGPARAAGAGCDPYLYWDRCLGILFQDIRFTPDAVGMAEHPLDIVLGDRIRFLGYDLAGKPVPGHALFLTLYWQALESVEEDYIIFVHLTEPRKTLLVQHDAAPLSGLYPTSKWVVGDVFSHRAILEIPGETPLGRYDLWVGMYTYPDIVRLPVASDRLGTRDSLIWLQSVDIQP